MGVRGARFRCDCLGAASVVSVEDLVDALARNTESFGDVGGCAALISDGSDDGEVAVRTVHSVKHVPTHQSNVTDTAEVTLSVNYDATDLSRITTPSAGTPRQICRDFRHLRAHHCLNAPSMSLGAFLIFLSFRRYLNVLCKEL